MINWLREHWLYAAVGAFFGATAAGIQAGIEAGWGAGVRWAAIGAVSGAVVFLVVEAARSYDRARENQTAKAVQPITITQPLSPWNPVHHLRFLWWLFMRPDFLQAYRAQAGEENTRQMGAWSASILIWLPLFTSGLAGALSSDKPLQLLLIGGVFLVAALFITCVVGTPQELNLNQQGGGMGGVSLAMIEGFVFLTAALTAISITGIIGDNHPLSIVLVAAFGIASGSALGIADSVWEVKADDDGDKPTVLLDVVSLIHMTIMSIITIGITAGTALAFAITSQAEGIETVDALLVIGSITAAVPAISLAFVTDFVARVLQRSASARHSFGRLARWLTLMMLILSQVVPVWAVALRGWPLF
jgi:hypothetical protein